MAFPAVIFEKIAEDLTIDEVLNFVELYPSQKVILNQVIDDGVYRRLSKVEHLSLKRLQLRWYLTAPLISQLTSLVSFKIDCRPSKRLIDALPDRLESCSLTITDSFAEEMEDYLQHLSHKISRMSIGTLKLIFKRNSPDVRFEIDGIVTHLHLKADYSIEVGLPESLETLWIMRSMALKSQWPLEKKSGMISFLDDFDRLPYFRQIYDETGLDLKIPPGWSPISIQSDQLIGRCFLRNSNRFEYTEFEPSIDLKYLKAVSAFSDPR